MSLHLTPQLHKSLLLGLERAPLPAGSAADSGDGLLPLLQQSAPATRLWLTLAGSDILHRAAAIPPQVPPGPAALPDRRPCPPAAARLLCQILDGIQPQLLESWLALAQASQVHLPHICLPTLLDRGLQSTALRPALQALLGPRGQWLVAQHPAWATCYGVAGDDLGQRWQLGNVAERATALRAMRLADPVAALAALQQDWAAAPAEQRTGLLPSLAQGLGPLDEAFLEKALDDRSKEVRAQARTLLVCLPGPQPSQLVQRCLSKLEPALDCKKRLLFGPQLTVNLPELCDKAMQRDGIGLQNYRDIGEKAGWLLDLVGCIPLTHWSQQWELSPQAIVDLAAKHEFSAALLHGFAQSCVRSMACLPLPSAAKTERGIPGGQSDNLPDSGLHEWIAALLLIGISRRGLEGVAFANSGLRLNPMHDMLAQLGKLPPATRDAMIEQWQVNDHFLWADHTQTFTLCAEAVRASNTPWSAKLSKLVLGKLQDGVLKRSPNYKDSHMFACMAETLAVHDPAAPADLPPYFECNWLEPELDQRPALRDLVSRLRDTLRFRQSMRNSFLETQ